ncbi:MAG: thiamine pyrophosphate-binding protein [Caulobacteraceae bacterium]
MKLSDYVAEFVAGQKIAHVFMVPGGGAMHLDDSFFHHPDIETVSNLHEQASAMGAETYAKVSGGLGCALLTTGPGGTNAVTGLAGAWLDSTPCLFISGQAKRSDLKGSSGVRQMGLQEVDIVSVVEPLTKFAKTVMDPADIRRDLEEAVHTALSGRPGPVWIDIPLDVQGATIDPESLAPFVPPPAEPSPTDLPAAVDETLRLLANAKRPIILVGNGVRLSHAEDEMHALVAELGVPVLATWLSLDMFAEDDPLYVGKPGSVAPRGVNFALQNADFLLVLGCRLDMSITGYAPERLAREATKVMVDIDAAEIAKLAPHLDLQVQADAGDFLRALRQRLPGFNRPDWSAWTQRCRDWKTKYPVVLPEHRAPDQKVSVYNLAEALGGQLSEGQVIVSGSSGAGIEIFIHAVQLKRGQRLLTTASLGSMGYGLPAAIGACLASGRRPLVAVDGDGGLQMNVQEFETVRRLNLPIKYFVLSNEGYSSIRTSQNRWFGRLSGADSSSGMTLPDILKVAAAYGLKTAQITDQRNLKADIAAVLAMDGPVVCEVITIPDEQRIPSMSSAQRADGSLYSKPIEDLWPFLDREEFLANMIVAPVAE